LLWQYLNAIKKILVLKSIPSKNLEIRSEHVSELIENGDDSFANYVPEKIFHHIKDNGLFGYSRNKKN